MKDSEALAGVGFSEAWVEGQVSLMTKEESGETETKLLQFHFPMRGVARMPHSLCDICIGGWVFMAVDI